MIEIPRTAGDFARREKGIYKIRLLGLGGAGLNIMSRVASEGGDSKLMTVVDTDVRALKSSRAAVRLQLGSDVTHGMGCGGDPDLGRESAEMSEAQIREILRGSDLVFLCVGLGGGTGSGAAPLIARIAREERCFVIAAVTLPFHFEGRRRQQQAMDSLTDLRQSVGALLTFENDRMGDLIVPSSGVQEAFAAADRMISQSVRAITVLLDRPGMIRVTLEDLLSFLNGKDAKCSFGFGEAEGASRAERATNEALAHHLKEQSAGLTDASSVLIHLAGDSSVTFAEVEQVAAAVATKTHPDCKVLLGVSASQELEKKLSVAIIASVDQSRRMTRTDSEPSGQELQVTPLVPLVDLPPVVRQAPIQAPMAAPVWKPAPVPAAAAVSISAPLSSHVPAGNGLTPDRNLEMLSDVATSPVDYAMPRPVGPLVRPSMPAPAVLPPMGPPSISPVAPVPLSPLPAPAPVSVPVSQPLPHPPPLAPLPSVAIKPAPLPVSPGMDQRGVESGTPPIQGLFHNPAPLPPVSSAPILSPLAAPVEHSPQGLAMPSKAPVAAPPSNDVPEAPRPLRTQGSLGDPLDYPATGKGRFEGTEPTKIEGIDLDWPTFLRKKRSAQG